MTEPRNADDQARATLANAHTALLRLTASVAADQWTAPTPCSQWTVAQVLQHATGDQLAYVKALTGSGGPTYDPFAPSGQIGGDPEHDVQTAVTAAATAWAAVSGPTAPTPLPQGELPLSVAIGACALDAAVHGWDIAVATGQPAPITTSDARFLMEVAEQIVEPLRQWGAYAEAVPTGPDDLDRLLGYLGRDPGWSA